MTYRNAFHAARVALITAVFVGLGGCGIPDSMHVRMGGEPRHQDDDVLFRTTYYFRVLDFCAAPGGEGQDKRIKSDSLYRFKMTGKGKSTFNHVRFEAGTLQAWQIDPLGASVELDNETGKFHYVSQQKREEMLKQDRYYAEVGRLRSLLSSLGCGTASEREQCTIVNTKIAENLRLIGPGASDRAATASDTALVCGAGLPARRGFQVLGPQGWRTYDQDERLVLAMSSSGKPLLDALRDVSSRAMAQKRQGLAQETVLTGYLAIAQARAKLGDLEKAEPEQLAAALAAAVEAFNKQGGK